MHDHEALMIYALANCRAQATSDVIWFELYISCHNFEVFKLKANHGDLKNDTTSMNSSLFLRTLTLRRDHDTLISPVNLGLGQ